MATREKKAKMTLPEAQGQDVDLQNEVSAFASRLGLSTGNDTGFNDSDFRPEVATQQIGQKGELHLRKDLFLGQWYCKMSAVFHFCCLTFNNLQPR